MIHAKPTKEGTVFLVPLEDSGFAIGLLIRADKKGRAYGEFYGPKIIDVNSMPSQAIELSQLLRSDHLLMKCKFGDHGLCQRRWIALGQVSGWDRKKWPLPQFYRPHDDKNLCFVTVYDDELNFISESIRPFKMGKGLPLDQQLGSNVVEKKLSARL